MITDLLFSLIKYSQKQPIQMKPALQLSALAAVIIMMVSAAPSKMTCHTLSEAHANAVCKGYRGSTGYILGECGMEGICIYSNKSTTVKMANITHDLTRSRPYPKKQKVGL